MDPRDFQHIPNVEYARIVRRFSRNTVNIQSRWDARRLRRCLHEHIEHSSSPTCKKM